MLSPLVTLFPTAGAFPALRADQLSMFMIGIYTDPLKPDRLL